MRADKHISALDSLLVPNHFERRGRVWNRNVDGYIDVVDLQLSKYGDSFTVNIGVLDEDIYEACWGHTCLVFYDEASCTVRERLGVLVAGRDTWWDIRDHNSAGLIAARVQEFAMNFFDQSHSPEAMERFLRSDGGRRVRYPPESIYLALILMKMGKRVEACRLLMSLEKVISGSWAERMRSIVENSCKQA